MACASKKLNLVRSLPAPNCLTISSVASAVLPWSARRLAALKFSWRPRRTLNSNSAGIDVWKSNNCFEISAVFDNSSPSSVASLACSINDFSANPKLDTTSSYPSVRFLTIAGPIAPKSPTKFLAALAAWFNVKSWVAEITSISFAAFSALRPNRCATTAVFPTSSRVNFIAVEKLEASAPIASDTSSKLPPNSSNCPASVITALIFCEKIPVDFATSDAALSIARKFFTNLDPIAINAVAAIKSAPIPVAIMAVPNEKNAPASLKVAVVAPRKPLGNFFPTFSPNVVATLSVSTKMFL